MEYKISSEGDKKRISFSGELTIEYAKGIKSALKLALKETKSLEIDLSMATGVDTSFLQLLFSLKKTAVDEGLKVCETGKIPDAIRESYISTGFSGIEKCLTSNKL